MPLQPPWVPSSRPICTFHHEQSSSRIRNWILNLSLIMMKYRFGSLEVMLCFLISKSDSSFILIISQFSFFLQSLWPQKQIPGGKKSLSIIEKIKINILWKWHLLTQILLSEQVNPWVQMRHLLLLFQTQEASFSTGLSEGTNSSVIPWRAREFPNITTDPLSLVWKWLGIRHNYSCDSG